LVLEVGSAIIFGLAFGQIGLLPEYALLIVWPLNLLAAWHISKAARAQQKSPLLYGVVAALLPAAALIAFCLLYNADLAARFDRRLSAKRSSRQ
jgi:hypothetical protein